ncbi:MAG: DUF448 domain-containing protein [Desulfovibrionaceae bacterium]|nr:DUF448 domain-containing protein [Desulfovibrionaceae bacterium]MBF0515118.1 DUF448 domain-containing protein [Desulfovibrionaceae bacterium]
MSDAKAQSEAASEGPVRTCVICRKRGPKAGLTRHVIVQTGGHGESAAQSALAADPRAVMPGRGFYLCRDAACGAKFHKFSGWRKHFHGGSAR